MNKITKTEIYRISNIETILPGYSHHWIVTSDIAPEIIADPNQPKSPVESGLWYHLNSNEKHNFSMFNYYSEKLALNTESSLFLMEQWNKALQDPRSIPQYDICEILEINRAQYALIELGDKIIILKDSPHSPPNQVRVNAGRGGYLYAELNSNLELHLGHELTEEYLRRRLGIYDKEEMCDFIEIWNNYYWGTKND